MFTYLLTLMNWCSSFVDIYMTVNRLCLNQQFLFAVGSCCLDQSPFAWLLQVQTTLPAPIRWPKVQGRNQSVVPDLPSAWVVSLLPWSSLPWFPIRTQTWLKRTLLLLFLLSLLFWIIPYKICSDILSNDQTDDTLTKDDRNEIPVGEEGFGEVFKKPGFTS